MQNRLNIIVTGTDTGVGKTFICILLGKFLQKMRRNFIVYKPFATGIINNNGEKEIEDIYLYRKNLNLQVNKNLFVYKTFNFPNAPTIAAKMENKKLSNEDFYGCLRFYKRLSKYHNNIIVEGIGGLLVPLTFNKLFLDFIKELKLPVILVTTNKLGTINHTLLSIKVLKENNIRYKLVFNKVDPKKTEKENKAVLADIKRFGKIRNEIYQIPYCQYTKMDRVFRNVKLFCL